MDDMAKKIIILDIIRKITANNDREPKPMMIHAELTAEEIQNITGKEDGGWTSDYGDEAYDYRFEGNGFSIIGNNRCGGNNYSIKCIEFSRPDIFILDNLDELLKTEDWISEGEIQQAVDIHRNIIKAHQERIMDLKSLKAGGK